MTDLKTKEVKVTMNMNSEGSICIRGYRYGTVECAGDLERRRGSVSRVAIGRSVNGFAGCLRPGTTSCDFL